MVRFDDLDYKRVGFDRIDGVEISTVWLGLNHGMPGGPPKIFESMIFGGDQDQHQWRYTTEAGALDGHRRIAEAIKAGKAFE